MFRVLVFLVLFLGLFSTSYGDVIIGDWETSSSYDGWVVGFSDGSIITPWYAFGATVGVGSLRVIAAQGYSFDAVTATGNENTLLTTVNWWANDTFEVDITRLAADYTYTGNSYGSYFHVMIGAGNSDGSKQYAQDSDIFLSDWGFDGSVDMTRTLVVDYTSIKNDIITNSCSLDWVMIAIGQYSGGWAEENMIYYLDNARLVPEPMTIVLLGLGGLTLIRRKK